MTSRALAPLLFALCAGMGVGGCSGSKAEEARAQAEASKPIAVTVQFEAPATCGVRLDDIYYGLPEAQDALDEALKTMSKTRPVTIHAESKIPYRCMGPVIYYFERAGFDRIDGGGHGKN